MAGRPEGGAKDGPLSWPPDRSAGQRPPLPCQASPPQGGRLAVITAFANLRRRCCTYNLPGN
ncbi:MAG: hypothetical protein EOS04_06865 [Mesorhizobium sp.]|nr:MAG: hypothetical protein EOR98_10540 [Mesorhizobium sp.]RWN59596.1 MAG: hypothetical protein EOS00_19180 [Mesorhizobium sp.]RWN76631.1 MAG: hypothetical protein EOS02_14230 [Mesorhizobium sp.]RWN81400.1 MAG: hypothetical protein EOS01_10325 [Mesorhizobium sp.]RWN90398.1 MAG: hypothetical protein EOS04_06865 [Mesorhizobium sp.]